MSKLTATSRSQKEVSGSQPRESIPPPGPPRRRLTMLTLTLVCSCVIAAAVWRSSDFSRPAWYVEGSRAFAAGNVPLATKILSQGLVGDPHYSPAYEVIADSYMAERQYGLALVVLQRLLAVDPERPHVYTRIAEASVDGSPRTTLEAASEAVIQEPRSPRARMLLAYAIAREGSGKDALIEAAAASQLVDSASVAQEVKKASTFESNPQQLAGLLKSLVYHLPYAQ